MGVPKTPPGFLGYVPGYPNSDSQGNVMDPTCQIQHYFMAQFIYDESTNQVPGKLQYGYETADILKNNEKATMTQNRETMADFPVKSTNSIKDKTYHLRHY